MPQIIRLSETDYKCDTVENTNAKFDKITSNKFIKLENIKNNGIIQLNYDINNYPKMELSSNNKKTLITDEKIKTSSGEFNKLEVDGDDVATKNDINLLKNNINTINTNNLTIINKVIEDLNLEEKFDIINNNFKKLNDRVNELEKINLIKLISLDQDPTLDLHLIEFEYSKIGKIMLFKLNDSKIHLYYCYNIDNNISYWRLVSPDITL